MVLLCTKYYSCEQIKKEETGEACGTYRGHETKLMTTTTKCHHINMNYQPWHNTEMMWVTLPWDNKPHYLLLTSHPTQP